jgi:protein CpxP
MKLSSIALVAALSLAGGASFAQPAAPPASGPHAEGHHWQRPDPAQMAERHAQHLRDALQLRPDQEPALRALIAAMQPPPGAMDKMREAHEAGAKLTTPERLDRMQAMMAEHEARFREHVDAIKRFYAQLSPSQQKAFDAMPMMGMGGHGMHGGMHGMNDGMKDGHRGGGHQHGLQAPPAGH